MGIDVLGKVTEPCVKCSRYHTRLEMFQIGADGPYCHTCFYVVYGLSQANTHPDPEEVDLTQWIGQPEKEEMNEGYFTGGQVTLAKVASDGGSTSYYELPEHATELRHLISHKGMSFARGNLMKACYRLGEKEGNDALYDLNKMEFFIQDMKEMLSRGERI